MECRGSLICAALLIWYRNGLAKSLPFAGNTWFCFFKYPFKSISCGLSSTTKKTCKRDCLERKLLLGAEKNLPFIFVSISYVIYYQLLPGIFAASPGAIAGVTLNEFTQMRLFVMHSNFRLCLPGFCIWMQKKWQALLSFLYNLHAEGGSSSGFWQEWEEDGGGKKCFLGSQLPAGNWIAGDFSQPLLPGAAARRLWSSPIHSQENEPPSAWSHGRE